MHAITLILYMLFTITLAVYLQQPLPPQIQRLVDTRYPDVSPLDAEGACLEWMKKEILTNARQAITNPRHLVLQEHLQRRYTERAPFI